MTRDPDVFLKESDWQRRGAQTYYDYKKEIENSLKSSSLLNDAKATNISNSSRDLTTVSTMLGQGITPNQANAMLASDIKQDELAVKKTLAAAGVKGVPQNVYNGLVSYQNQTGDISYAYVKGEKISLTELYRAKDWDRVSSLIAADERDRSRRIAEAGIISNRNYGKVKSEEAIVQQGITKTNELLSKGNLNQQTSTDASAQQKIAIATSYYNQTGKLLPGQNFAFNNMIANNADKNIIGDIIKKNLAKDWPY